MKNWILLAFLAWCRLQGEVIPGHSHNDYARERPLTHALQLGFASIEADIFLTNNALLVGHEPKELQGGRTLEKLYLEPLAAIIKTNNGKLPGYDKPLILLVDIKTEAESTLAELNKLLAKYEKNLARVEDGRTKAGPVVVVISGNRATNTVAKMKSRLLAVDGRLTDLGNGVNKQLMPLVSDNWTKIFKWNGEGEFSQPERDRLQDLVRKVHAEGKLIRFWATPDKVQVWKELREAKADLVNVDQIDAFAEWVRKN